MPCKDAIIENVVTVSESRTVAEAMEMFREHNIRALPVVDGKGAFLGIFNVEDLLARLLPAPLDFEENRGIDLRLDAFIGASPDLSRHLSAILPLKVSEIMSRDIPHVSPETSLWEGIRCLVRNHGRPVPVLQEGSHILVGLVSSQSTIHALLEKHGPDTQRTR